MGTPGTGRQEGQTIMTLRRALAAVFLFGVAGSGLELVLLEHTEDLWQWSPLLLMGLSVPALVWMLMTRGRASVRMFQVLMWAFLVSGVVGLYLHYRGNVEFELEMYPSLGGFGLFWEAIKGATPTLAPGTMPVLGLIGLLYTYRFPADGSPGNLE